MIFLLLFSFTPPSFAHMAGQPPFFKINGVFSELYPVPTTSLIEFRLAQDKPPALYQVNEVIQFEMETQSLPVPPQILDVTTFEWDFGDGSPKVGGLKNVHSYSRPGSYFLEITAKTDDLPQPQLIQSVVLHIVPFQGYQMARAKILVNGQGVSDALLDDVRAEFGQEFIFDASSSIVGSGKIVEYFWDLGNGKSAIGEKITVRYDKNQYAFFPVLRIKDEFGIISDDFIQVTNSDSEKNFESGFSLPPHIHKNLPFIIGGIFIGLSLIFGPFIYSEITSRKKNKK